MDSTEAALDPKVWQWTTFPDGTPGAICLVCRDTEPRQIRHCIRHENTQTHKERLTHTATAGSSQLDDGAADAPFLEPRAVESDATVYGAATMATYNLLAALSGDFSAPVDSATYIHQSDLAEERMEAAQAFSGFDFGLFEAEGDTRLDMVSPEEQAAAELARRLLEDTDIDLGLVSGDDVDEDDVPNEDGFIEEPVVAGGEDSDGEGGGRAAKRARVIDPHATKTKWFPWPDRMSCTLDILMHLPRSVFSQRQLDLFLWLLEVNGLQEVPSVRTTKSLNEALQNLCGIRSLRYKGALGHTYYVNDMAQIIAQEMANPNVRPHFSFYPEDSGSRISEARHAERWLHEIPDDQLTPMARINNEDYYIYELAMRSDGACCVPFRWFTRQQKLFALCWDASVVNTVQGAAWRIHMNRQCTVSEDQFLKPFPRLQRDVGLGHYNLPNPSLIFDVIDSQDSRVGWTYTNPAIGNRWRVAAKGHRVVAFASWMYCDDTSGNVSKKWNKHNSFLFTSANLPRAESSKEFNVHFLSTSNIAPPLEMLDGIVEQLDECQKNGIWAWDCLKQEPVLVIPLILALLGDNPMQSEFACHIGLRGRLFCRACYVAGAPRPRRKKKSGKKSNPNNDSDEDSDSGESADSGGSAASGSYAGSNLGSEVSDAEAAPASQGSNTGAKAAAAPVVLETFAAMVTRLKNFLKAGEPRTKADTMAKLGSLFDTATHPKSITKIKKAKTKFGLKDTYLDVFIKRLIDACKKKRGDAQQQAALDEAVCALPENVYSPVWRVKGLDPHRDTPVEVLHVILLGFIKYFWRDLINNQLKKKEASKRLLIQRLNSFDVLGLGISPLAGNTLVTYAGSLTGRDFRAIAQVAPFVIYDLVPRKCLLAWNALAQLVSIVWQPEIDNIDQYCKDLEQRIETFLLYTAQWSSRWFNKPKFHILVHLPAHIRRFGPAILFATEGFESFNAIIRAKSVHSNRHAPSRDIARAFAQGNRVRHLISGGLFLRPDVAVAIRGGDASATEPLPIYQTTRLDWQSVGPGPLSLVNRPSTVTQYLGLRVDKTSKDQAVTCVRDSKQGDKTFSETQTSSHCHSTTLIPHRTKESGTFHIGKTLHLRNGDVIPPGGYIVVSHDGRNRIARLIEILQVKGSPEQQSGQPNVILVRLQSALMEPTRYDMPKLEESSEFLAVKAETVICTVNVQHNCATNACTASGTRVVFQEREATSNTVSIIEHRNNPDDKIVNVGQMRNARHLGQFRLAAPALDTDNIITESAKEEIDKRKAASAAERGRGRGVVVPGRGRAGRGVGALVQRGRARGGHMVTGTSRSTELVFVPYVYEDGTGDTM